MSARDESVEAGALSARKRAVTLLRECAENEHQLAVQYLFAAFSVYEQRADVPSRVQGRVSGYRKTLVQLARESMGHWLTVQNLLHLLGEPRHLTAGLAGPEHQHFGARLEPLTRRRIGAYLLARRPAERPDNMSEERWQRFVDEVSPAVIEAYGPIKASIDSYRTVAELFASGLTDDDLVEDVTSYGDSRAGYEEWGYDADTVGRTSDYRVIVRKLDGEDVDVWRAEAGVALSDIMARVGGVTDSAQPVLHSHFERLYDLYDDIARISTDEHGVQVARLVGPHPYLDEQSMTGGSAISAQVYESTAISHPRARMWARLGNLRYRLLLMSIEHFFVIGASGEVFCYESDGDSPDLAGDRKPRGLVLLWAFDEMRRLGKIGRKLVQLPASPQSDEVKAGLPFAPGPLPDFDGSAKDWQNHLDAVNESLNLIANAAPRDKDDPFIRDLEVADEKRRRILEGLVSTNVIPGDELPAGFSKVAHIFEESVRGFSIAAHGNWWADITRDEFMGRYMLGLPIIARDANHGCRPDAYGEAWLPYILESDDPEDQPMPLHRPPIPEARIEFLKNWIDTGCLDDSRAPGLSGVHHERDPLPEE